MTTRQENLGALEALVDRHTLSGVLAMLSEICGEKEAHIATNWQDAALAKAWRKAELALDRLHVNIAI